MKENEKLAFKVALLLWVISLVYFFKQVI